MTRDPGQTSDPQDAPGFVERGNRYSRNGAYDRAISDYTAAIELDGALADAYFNRGVSYYELARYDDAIADLTRAIELAPDDDNFYSRRALAYLFNDQPELAQADEEKCQELRFR